MPLYARTSLIALACVAAASSPALLVAVPNDRGVKEQGYQLIVGEVAVTGYAFPRHLEVVDHDGNHELVQVRCDKPMVVDGKVYVLRMPTAKTPDLIAACG